MVLEVVGGRRRRRRSAIVVVCTKFARPQPSSGAVCLYVQRHKYLLTYTHSLTHEGKVYVRPYFGAGQPTDRPTGWPEATARAQLNKR